MILIIVTTVIISTSVTKYLYEPIQENHLTPEPYGEVSIENGVYKHRVGTQTWIRVYNRIGYFEERYEWNAFTAFANGTDAAKVIQDAIDLFSEEGRLFFHNGTYIIEGVVSTK